MTMEAYSAFGILEQIVIRNALRDRLELDLDIARGIEERMGYLPREHIASIEAIISAMGKLVDDGEGTCTAYDDWPESLAHIRDSLPECTEGRPLYR